MGYRPGLDGLRGIAIALVLVGHAGFGPPRLANLGVTLFFVLSGFLITRLLIEERRATGSVSLPAFYLRRARRLLPALFVMVAVVGIASGAWVGGLWALSYVGNWTQAADLGPFAHTWSLAIEEQFYLLWPLAFLFIGRWGVAVALTLCLVARFALPWTAEGLADSTITQAPALLIGVLLAYVSWSPMRWAPLWAGLGAILGAVAVAAPQVVSDPLAALAAVPLLLLAYHGTFGWRPAVRLGRISYGVYLWQTPLLLAAGATFAGTLASAGAIAAALAVAAVSYVLIEQPIRQARWPSRPSRIASRCCR